MGGGEGKVDCIFRYFLFFKKKKIFFLLPKQERYLRKANPTSFDLFLFKPPLYFLTPSASLLLKYVPTNYSAAAPSSLHLAFEILPLDQIRDIVVIIVVVVSAILLVARVPVPAAAAAVLFLQALVALRQFSQRGQTVGPELVEDAGDEFGEFLVFARAVDGEGVGRNRRVDWWKWDGQSALGVTSEGREIGWEGEEGRV